MNTALSAIGNDEALRRVDNSTNSQVAQDAAEERVDKFRRDLGPFVVAAESTRMAMMFTDATIDRHPIVFANDGFLALTGFDRSAVVGKDIAHILKQPSRRNHLSVLEQALGKGIEGSWDVWCRRADDRPFLATVFLSPVLDEEGVARQNFLSFVDVSGRLERLLTQREEFNALYDQAPGFVAALEGGEHRLTSVNPSYERLVGRTDLVGHRVIDLFPELAEQGVIELLDRVFQTGEAFVGSRMPIRFAARNGHSAQLKFVDFVYQPVLDATGRVTGLFIEGSDVTAGILAAEQLALLQDELAHTSRVNAMGMMAATLAHELNQPLGAVLNYAGASGRLVDPDAPNAAQLTEALSAIEESAARAGDIIRSVRELTRRGHTHKTRFNLKLAIAECVRLVRGAGGPDATIDERVPEDIDVDADRIQIQQVAINLLRNACEAAVGTSAPNVTIEATSEETQVVVSVADTGPGLTLASAENIFTWTDSSQRGGMGLGLAISRTILEAHNGRIWLERSDASGSEFRFSFPLAPVDTDSANG